MVQINQKKTVSVDVKTIRIHAKCTDRCVTDIVDQDGETIYQHDGYVPGFMPGDHYGDYVILDIDAESGQILNWKAPSPESLQEFIEEED